MGVARGRRGGAPPSWVWGVRGRALSQPRLPALWAGCRGPLPTAFGCGGGRGRGDLSPTPQRALLRAVGAASGWPGGGASYLGVGRPGSGALPPPTARRLGGLPGPTTHSLWVRGVAGVGTRHQPHSARSCELALRAVGAARGRPGGHLLAGYGASGVGRSPTPDCPPSGRAAGPTTHWLWVRGVAGVGTCHQPHSARSCVLWWRHQGGRGGGPLTWVWGVRGRALSHPRLPAVWAGCRGPLPTHCGCGELRAWGPVTSPTARALASWLYALWGRHEGARGGTSWLGMGRPGSGALPPPTARPLGGLPGPLPTGFGCGGLRAWGPVTNPTARALASWLYALWGRHEGARGGTSWLGMGRPGSGALPPPTARPLGGLPGPLPTAFGCGGLRAWGPVTNPTARALACCGGGMRVPGGAPLAGVWGVRGRALSHPRLPALCAGCRAPLPTGCGCGGLRAWGPVTNPTARALASLLCALLGAARGRRGGGALPAWRWRVRGRALSHPQQPVLSGVQPAPASHCLWVWCAGVGARLSLAPCPVPRFVVCCVRFPGSRHPVAVVAWHLSSCRGCGRRRASLACLVAPRWCDAPRPVWSLLVLRLAFLSPWCLLPPRGLSPPALLGGCAGHAEASREPGSLCLPRAPAEARALGALRVVPVRGPAMGLSLAGPSGFGLRLRALHCLACVDPVTDASGFPYRPSFDGGLGRCTGAVSCGRRHRPFRVGGRHARVPHVCACACPAWPGRADRPAGRVLMRLTFPLAVLGFLFCLFGPLRAGVALFVVVLSFFFVSFPLLPLVAPPLCPALRASRPGVPWALASFPHPPPFFFPSPPSVRPVVSCFACFPAWGALGLGVLLLPPAPFFSPVSCLWRFLLSGCLGPLRPPPPPFFFPFPWFLVFSFSVFFPFFSLPVVRCGAAWCVLGRQACLGGAVPVVVLCALAGAVWCWLLGRAVLYCLLVGLGVVLRWCCPCLASWLAALWFGAVCLGVPLPCVVFCCVVLSCGGVLPCSAVWLRRCMCLLFGFAAARLLCVFWGVVLCVPCPALSLCCARCALVVLSLCGRVGCRPVVWRGVSWCSAALCCAVLRGAVVWWCAAVLCRLVVSLPVPVVCFLPLRVCCVCSGVSCCVFPVLPVRCAVRVVCAVSGAWCCWFLVSLPFVGGPLVSLVARRCRLVVCVGSGARVRSGRRWASSLWCPVPL